MSNLLKDRYNEAFVDGFLPALQQVLPDLKQERLYALVFDENWGAKELKDRMAHLADVLHQLFETHYPTGVGQLIAFGQALLDEGVDLNTFEFMFLPAYIEQYGQDHFEASAEAMTFFGQHTSCEFAVRPFYLQYPEAMLSLTKVWAEHEQINLRRQASEGCRPRLPWAMALPFLKKDPSPILPILDMLKADPAEYVRRSVANNLNDISKDHPEVAMDLARAWKGHTKVTDWVVKHGLRTLLKQGHTEALRMHGFGSPEDLKVSEFRIQTPEVSIGEDLHFSFSLHNQSSSASLVRLEYGLYFLKANGKQSRKVFKISERAYEADEKAQIERKQPFKIISTRVLYPGPHALSLIVNGEEGESLPFDLVSHA
ncbi:MAG: DNA alkylation repair protein [Bacteroidota bacterium]